MTGTTNPAADRDRRKRGGRRAVVLAAAALAALAATRPAEAADAAAGKAKAAACSVCHGANGVSTTPDAPNLAGQPESYVAAQLRAYKSGARRHEVMSLMAQPLSDDDIANLAAWFSSLRIDARPPG
jgi:cytochrome c553